LSLVDTSSLLADAVYGGKDKVATSTTLSKVSSAAKADGASGGLGSQMYNKPLTYQKEYLVKAMEVLTTARVLSPSTIKSFSDMLSGIEVKRDGAKADTSGAKAQSGAEKLSKFLGTYDTSTTATMAGKLTEKVEDMYKIAEAINALPASKEKAYLQELIEILQHEMVPMIQEVVVGAIRIPGDKKDLKDAVGRLSGYVPGAVRYSRIPGMATSAMSYEDNALDIVANVAKLKLDRIVDDKVIKLISTALNIPETLITHPVSDKSKIEDRRKAYADTAPIFAAADKPTQLVMFDRWLRQVSGNVDISKYSFTPIVQKIAEMQAITKLVGGRSRMSPSDYLTQINSYKSVIKNQLKAIDEAIQSEPELKTTVKNAFVQAMQLVQEKFRVSTEYVNWMSTARAARLGDAVDLVNQTIMNADITSFEKLEQFAEVWWAASIPVTGFNGRPVIDSISADNSEITLFGSSIRPRDFIAKASKAIQEYLTTTQKVYVLFPEDKAKNIREGLLEAVYARNPVDKVDAVVKSLKEIVISAAENQEATPYIADLLDLYNLPAVDKAAALAMLAAEPEITALDRHHALMQLAFSRRSSLGAGFANKLYEVKTDILTAIAEIDASGTITTPGLEIKLRTALTDAISLHMSGGLTGRIPTLVDIKDNLNKLYDAQSGLAALKDLFIGHPGAGRSAAALNARVSAVARESIMTVSKQDFNKEIDDLYTKAAILITHLHL
jgi:hypothetical protein